MWRRIAFAIWLPIALIVTRWPLAPKYLFYIDNINFALAMDHFQPLLHQPHPPGYPLYVALLDTLHLLVPDPRSVQLLSGVIGSLIALLLLRKLTAELFGRASGNYAAALLFFLPAFWLAGIANQVRTFIAAGSVGVAFCAWRAMQSARPARWLLISGAALGVAGGFRPELLLLLFPLVFLAWMETSRKIATGVAAFVTLYLVASIWIGALIGRTGGLVPALHLFHTQWNSGTASTTLLSGASLRQSLFNAALAIYWTGIATLSWVGAVACTWKPILSRVGRQRATFLLVWFTPAFLFHALIYITDPDTALDCMPALLAFGACVLSIAVEHRALRDKLLVATAAMAVNVTLFFLSPLHRGRDASFAWVTLVGSETNRAIDGIRALSNERAATVVLDHALITSRQIEYYFPQVRTVSLDRGCPGSLKLKQQRIIWIRRFNDSLAPGPAFQVGHNLAYADIPAGARIEVAGCEFAN